MVGGYQREGGGMIGFSDHQPRPSVATIRATIAKLPRYDDGRVRWGAMPMAAKRLGISVKRMRRLAYSTYLRPGTPQTQPVTLIYPDGTDQWWPSIADAVKHTKLSRRQIEYAMEGPARRDGTKWRRASEVTL